MKTTLLLALTLTFFSNMALFSTIAIAQVDNDVISDRNESNNDRLDQINERERGLCTSDDMEQVEELTAEVCQREMKNYSKNNDVLCSLTKLRAGSCTALCTKQERTVAKLVIKSDLKCSPEVIVTFRELIVSRY